MTRSVDAMLSWLPFLVQPVQPSPADLILLGVRRPPRCLLSSGFPSAPPFTHNIEPRPQPPVIADDKTLLRRPAPPSYTIHPFSPTNLRTTPPHFAPLLTAAFDFFHAVYRFQQPRRLRNLLSNYRPDRVG